MDEIEVLRRAGFRPGAVSGDAHERVRRRVLDVVDAEPAERRERTLRRWPLTRLAVVGLVAAVALVAGPFGLLRDGPSAVARAAAAVGGPEGKIVHAVAIRTVTSPDGSTWTLRIETWRQSSPPFDSREIVTREGGAVRPEMASAGGVPEFYDARTNTIYTLPKRPVDKTATVGAELDPLAAGFTLDKLRAMLTSGRAREDGRVTIDGREAIRIVSFNPQTTLLVDPRTYEPIEWRVSPRVTTRFRTFERLPGSAPNEALISLRRQHPGAAVKPATSAPDDTDPTNK